MGNDDRLVHMAGRTFNKDEWREVSRHAKPTMTDIEFEMTWDEYWRDFDRRDGQSVN